MKLSGSNLQRLRMMVNLTAAFVAEHAGVTPRRLEQIESGEAAATLGETSGIFLVLKAARARQLRRHHDYCA